MQKSILERVESYLDSRQKWILAGQPLRSKERIREIYYTYCDKCIHHKHYCCDCCGCLINLGNGNIVPNKIAWATESCGLEKIGEEPLWKAEILQEQPIVEPPKKKGGCGCAGR